MKRIFTLFCSLFLLSTLSMAQVYVDEFDNEDAAFTGGSPSYTFSEANGEWSITASNTAPFDVFTYEFHDPTAGSTVSVDATGNNKVFVRAKASNVGTQLRIDLQDADGFVTSLAGITKTLTTDYQVLEFDFSGVYSDGGFGGTPCMSGPCPVDGANLSQLVFFTDPGIGGFNGTVVIDYVAFGEEPTGIIMSDVFQDHFEGDSSITSFIGTATYDLNLVSDTEMTITGDGTNPMWDPLTYVIRNPVTWDPIDIDVTDNHKMFIKIKSTVPNTTIRFDLIDIDGFANTQGSITKLVGTDYSIIEFDYAGTYVDLGFGGTPCTPDTAPCPVDASRVAQMNIFIEPGVGEFLGELTVDYISFGIPLEPAGPSAELLYEDHFNNETLEFTVETVGFIVSETGSDLIITGDGSSASFSAVSYILHDKDLAEPIFLDMEPGQNKVYVRARAENGSVPLRLDLVDTTGYITNQAGLTKIISDEFETYEYNFTGNYFDGGFGGTPCVTGPCPVDEKAIRQALVYVDAVAGGYDGTVYIDFISVGQPAEDDNGSPVGIPNYADQFDDILLQSISDPGGLESSFADSEWTILGDGTSGMFAAINYAVQNDDGEAILANAVNSQDKLYFRAKTNVPGTELRIDLQDSEGFVTNAAASAFALTEEYQVYEIDYSANYNDGGFGGSPCTAGPCPVDGERIANLQLFTNPGVGALDGTVTLDWVSFGQPLGGGGGPTGEVNYVDEIDANTVLFIETPDGYTSTTDDFWTIEGDGAAGAFSPVIYTPHNDAGEPVLVDAVGSDDLLFVMARASEEATLRIDLQDVAGFVSNANAQAVTLSTEFEMYELNYSGAYNDGGFGGTPCNAGPCPVDGTRIEQVQFFVNPNDGGFNGTVEIDWFAFGMPIVGVEDVTRLSSLKAYPNPVANELNIAIESIQAGEMEISIFNSVGQIVHIDNLGFVNTGNTIRTLNVATLPQGMYSVNISIDGVHSGFLKFIK